MSVAKGNIRTTIVLDGQTKYENAIQRLKKSQAALRAEAKALTSTYNSQTTAEEKLINKKGILERQIKAQTQIVQTYRKELDVASEKENENGIAVNEAAIKYNNAAAKLNYFESQLQEVNEEIKKNSSWHVKNRKEWQETGEAIQSAGNKLEAAGKKMSAVSSLTGAGLITASKAAIDYEDAFVGVKKTVDATDEQFNDLYKSILDLSTEMPTSASEIAEVAETAGQLGIAYENIEDFVKIMVELGDSTNLTANEAASALAKFANVTKLDPSDYERLGSTIVALGNNFSTTESDIVSMATRLASTGSLTGLTQSQIMALATALSSVGVEAEAGGSAASKLLKMIATAVETGSENLKQFASASNMSVSEFKTLWEKDAVSALGSFINGLNDTERNGKSAIAMLDEMGIKETRLSNAVLALASSNNVLTRATDMASSAWDENVALAKEAETKYETLKSKIEMLKNSFQKLLVIFGGDLMPEIDKGISKIEKFTVKWADLDDEQRKHILSIAKIVTATGPLLLILGKTTTGVGKLIVTTSKFISVLDKVKTAEAVGGLKKLNSAIAQVATGSGAASAEVAAFTKSLAAGETVLVIMAVAAALYGLTAAYKSVTYGSKETRETIDNIGDGINEFRNKIDEANGSLDSIKEGLNFSEKESALEEQYKNLQDGIFNLAKSSSDSRDKLTDDELAKLDELLTKMNDVTDEKLSMYETTMKKIEVLVESESALTDEQAAEYVKKNQNAYEEAVNAAKDYYASQLVMLNDNFYEKGTISQEYYDSEKKRLQEDFQNKQDSFQQLYNANADAISNKLFQEQDGYAQMKQAFDNYNSEMQAAQQAANEQYLADSINGGEGSTGIALEYALRKKQINDDFSADFLASNQETVSAYLATIQSTIDSGGTLSEEQAQMCQSILSAYDTMPKGAKKSFGDTMENIRGVIESYDFKNKGTEVGEDFNAGVEIGLNDSKKVENAAESVGSRLLKSIKNALGIKSPAKKGKEIGKFFDQGIAIGVADNARAVYQNAREMAEGLLKNSIPDNATIKLKPQLSAIESNYKSALANSMAMQQAIVQNSYINSNAYMQSYYSNENLGVENQINLFKKELIYLLKNEFDRSDGFITEKQAGRAIAKCLKSVNM